VTNTSSDIVFVVMSMGCGGTERVVSQITDNLVQRGLNITVISLADVGSDFFELASAIVRYKLGMNHECYGVWRKISSYVTTIIALRQLLRSLKPKKVVSFLPTPNILALAASIGLRFERIVSERNDPYLQKEVNWIWRFLRNATYPIADIITVNSIQAESYCQRFSRFSHVVFLENPFVPRISTGYQSDENSRQKVILFVGRLVYQKGVDVLLECFQDSIACKEGWKLVIVGEGSEMQSLKTHCTNLGLDESVVWRGVVKDISGVFQKASIFVLPSRYEGTSNALLEALSNGLPVVCTEKTGSNYVVNGFNGIMSADLSVKSMRENLDQLVSNQELRKFLASNAKSTIEAREIERQQSDSCWEQILS
jgi:glycosyltransferase involved in cell wall biosynthesis